MTASNDNGSANVNQAFDKLESAMADFVRGFTAERTKNADLTKENGELKAKVTDAEKALSAEKDARKADNEGVIARIGRISTLLGGAAAVVLLLALFGFVSFPAGNTRQQVADNSPQLASLDKKLGDIDLQVGKTKLQVDGLNDKFAALTRADVFKDSGPASATASTELVSIENWQMLAVAYRSKIFSDACQGKVKWDAVNTELYQAGLAYVTPVEAALIVKKCDVAAIVKKAPTITADADERSVQDEATVQPAVVRDDGNVGPTNAQYAPPNPWGVTRPTPVYGRPAYTSRPAPAVNGGGRCPVGYQPLYENGRFCGCNKHVTDPAVTHRVEFAQSRARICGGKAPGSLVPVQIRPGVTANYRC